MATVSTVPAVLDALVERARARFPQTGADRVKVLDGGPATDGDIDHPGLLCIAFTSVPGEPAVEDARTREQMTSEPDRERYDITSVCSSWKGEKTDAQAVRDGAYDILDELAAELAAEQTLGGACLRARITSHLFQQEQTTKGAVATIRFVINVDAFTR